MNIEKSQQLAATLLGLSGLSYVVAITFMADDASFLIQLNILVPIVLITFSLSVLTMGLSKLLIILKQAFFLLIFDKKIDSLHFNQLLNIIVRYGYISAILWIVYSAIYTFGDGFIDGTSFISYSLISLLYAFIFAEFFARPVMNKHTLYLSGQIKDEKNG